MDTFTEKILARARERQKMLEVYTTSDDKIGTNNSNCCNTNTDNKKEILDSDLLHTNSNSGEKDLEADLSRISKHNSRTRVSSDIPGSPKAQLKTLNIQQENFNMEIKVTSTEDVRVEIEIGEQDCEVKEPNLGGTKLDCGLRDKSKKTLKQLGKLYSGDDSDISSPIHRTETKFYENDPKDEQVKSNVMNIIPKSPGSGLRKLAHLAEVINQWEDDVHPQDQKTEPKKLQKQKASQPLNKIEHEQINHNISKQKNYEQKENCSPEKKNISTLINTCERSETPNSKKVSWDKGILDSLESQGFTRTDSNSRLVYTYNSREKYAEPDKFTQKSLVRQENSNCIPVDKEVIQKCNNSENNASISTSCGSKIITKMVNSTNGANKIFPNSTKGKTAFTPSSPTKHIKSTSIADKAAMFETASPIKQNKDPALLSVSERKALFEKNKGEVLIPKAPFGMAPPVKVESIMNAQRTKFITNESVTNKPKIEKVIKPTIVNENGKNQFENHVQKTVINHKPIVHEVIPKSTEIVADKNSPTIAIVQQSGGIASRVAALMQNKSTISEAQIANSTKSQRQKEMDLLLNRFNKNKEVLNEAIDEEYSEEDSDTTEETAMLPEKDTKVVITSNTSARKSAEKRKSGNKICSTEDSPVVAAILEDVKRIKVSPAKVGRLYPNLSDIEAATETETDIQTRTPSPENQQSSFSEDNTDSDDDPNTSFGRDILEAVCRNNVTPSKRLVYADSTASDLSSILEDNYLEESSNENIVSPGPTPPKKICQKTPQKAEMQPSNSFNYRSFNTPNKCFDTPKNDFASPLKSPPRKSSSEIPTYVVEGDNVLPLTHTVSFYRKQQNQSQTPLRHITRLPSVEQSPGSDAIPEEVEAVKQKMIEMQEEVHKQQNIISQTSQALNLCSSTPEFSGSTEQVEAERVLLLATHRRQAALHELQRLEVEKTLRPQSHLSQNLPLEKGTLTISKIVLPLKHKYVKALAAAGGKGHHVVCLVKCGEQVIPTKLVSTVVSNAANPDTELTIPGNITLKNIYSDFTITFEVYCLQAQEEFLPHEVKYHINKKTNNKLITPKKSKHDSRMVMPIRESPAGPQAVRTSSFALMGYVIFSVQAINKKIWSLNNTPPMSPLDGTVEMRISCELAISVEHRGFLTMFEDVSGFGAWHRRWCLLKQQTLSYWKYPDDEKKKAPIETIDLSNCITKNVGPVSREICARLHTFLIETERDALPHDKASLVTVRKGEKTVIRHLLSADTKEERIEWCIKLNAALTSLWMWGKSQ